MTPYPDSKDKQLIKALSSLKSDPEIDNFLRDLLTTRELKEAANRFEIAKLLYLGNHSYLQIAKLTHTSTTTVTRVNDWLFNKPHHGYLTALQRLYPKT